MAEPSGLLTAFLTLAMAEENQKCLLAGNFKLTQLNTMFDVLGNGSTLYVVTQGRFFEKLLRFRNVFGKKKFVFVFGDPNSIETFERLKTELGGTKFDFIFLVEVKLKEYEKLAKIDELNNKIPAFDCTIHDKYIYKAMDLKEGIERDIECLNCHSWFTSDKQFQAHLGI